MECAVSRADSGGRHGADEPIKGSPRCRARPGRHPPSRGQFAAGDDCPQRRRGHRQVRVLPSVRTVPPTARRRDAVPGPGDEQVDASPCPNTAPQPCIGRHGEPVLPAGGRRDECVQRTMRVLKGGERGRPVVANVNIDYETAVRDLHADVRLRMTTPPSSYASRSVVASRCPSRWPGPSTAGATGMWATPAWRRQRRRRQASSSARLDAERGHHHVDSWPCRGETRSRPSRSRAQRGPHSVVMGRAVNCVRQPGPLSASPSIASARTCRLRRGTSGAARGWERRFLQVPGVGHGACSSAGCWAGAGRPPDTEANPVSNIAPSPLS